MLNENKIEVLITACLTGKATDEEQGILTEWIHENPEHLRYYQDFVNIWQLIHPAFDPDGIDVEKAENRIMEKISKTSLIKKLWVYWQRVAAVILVPLLIPAAYLFINNKEDVSDEIGYHELKSPHGMFSQVDLPDGTKVWLNSGSSLKYPLKFRQGQRHVFLEGEGYFEVHSDKKNPFVVTTDQMTLIATGTAFNIEAYTADSMRVVTMVEGTTDVVFGETPPITLKPGARILYNNQNFKKEIIETDPYKWYAWKDGLMIFRDDPLYYVFKRLEQTFNVKINVKDTEIANEPYRATFEDESLDVILQLLKMSAPIRFVRQEKKMTTNYQYEKQQIEVYKRKSDKINSF